jgi:hypothetical protein
VPVDDAPQFEARWLEAARAARRPSRPIAAFATNGAPGLASLPVC